MLRTPLFSADQKSIDLTPLHRAARCGGPLAQAMAPGHSEVAGTDGLAHDDRLLGGDHGAFRGLTAGE